MIAVLTQNNSSCVNDQSQEVTVDYDGLIDLIFKVSQLFVSDLKTKHIVWINQLFFSTVQIILTLLLE